MMIEQNEEEAVATRPVAPYRVATGFLEELCNGRSVDAEPESREWGGIIM